MKDNRRDFIKKSAALAAAVSVTGLNACKDAGQKEGPQSKAGNVQGKGVQWPVTFGPDRPKICVGIGAGDTKSMRQYKQAGVDYVLMGGPKTPWTEQSLREIMDPFRAEGLTVINMMIGGNNNIIYGREGRDEELRIIQDSIVAAGKAGLPVVEYNFYAHRFMAGYYEVIARGGSGVTGFDYDRANNLPPDDGKLMTADELWENLTWFLKGVVPVAEKAGVRLALHPNDPPIPMSHGHAQIMGTFNDWKRLIELVDSPANGMTYDCGVSRETG